MGRVTNEAKAREMVEQIASSMALSGKELTPDAVERLYQRALERLEGRG